MTDSKTFDIAEVLQHFLANVVEVALLELPSGDRCHSAECDDATRKDCDSTTWTAPRAARWDSGVWTRRAQRS